MLLLCTVIPFQELPVVMYPLAYWAAHAAWIVGGGCHSFHSIHANAHRIQAYLGHCATERSGCFQTKRETAQVRIFEPGLVCINGGLVPNFFGEDLQVAPRL